MDKQSYEYVDVIENPCTDTINGWVWYCDAHDTHGNADTVQEAEHMQKAHVKWHGKGA